jgi:hypothetical protein
MTIPQILINMHDGQKLKKLYDLTKDDLFCFPENRSILYTITSTEGTDGERQFFIKPIEHDGFSFWQLNTEVVWVSSFKKYGR